MSFRLSLCIFSLSLALAWGWRRAVEFGERKGTSGHVEKITIRVYSFPDPIVTEASVFD
jgi:hypothetical protein